MAASRGPRVSFDTALFDNKTKQAWTRFARALIVGLLDKPVCVLHQLENVRVGEVICSAGADFAHLSQAFRLSPFPISLQLTAARALKGQPFGFGLPFTGSVKASAIA